MFSRSSPFCGISFIVLAKWYFNSKKSTSSLPAYKVHFPVTFPNSVLLLLLRLFLYPLETGGLLHLESHRHFPLSVFISKSIFLCKLVSPRQWVVQARSLSAIFDSSFNLLDTSRQQPRPVHSTFSVSLKSVLFCTFTPYCCFLAQEKSSFLSQITPHSHMVSIAPAYRHTHKSKPNCQSG